MKKLIIVLICISLTTNINAAVVSDNDGAAFITKAEFDSLKNTFQSQLDFNNRTIDNKIENAISTYIAGAIQSTQSNKSNICYDENGILAPRANYADLAWTEGLMNVGFRILYESGSVSNDLTCGVRIMDWKGKTPATFSELAVKNVDYTNGNAEWVGRIKTYQYFYTSSFDTIYGGNTELSTAPEKYASLYNGWYAANNMTFILANNSVNLAHLQYATAIGEAHLGVFARANLCRLTREILETKDTNIICVPQSVACKRFSNVDEIRDWCNDDSISGHTQITTLAPLFDETTSNATSRHLSTSGKRVATTLTYTMDFHSSTHNTGRAAINYVLPYFGFVKNATDYSKIWTSKYDSYVDELYKADNTSNLYTDSEGKKHLFISAGCPIVYLNKGELLTIDLEFEDKTKNYDVWFKYGTFNKVNANSDSNLVSTNDIYYGANKNTHATIGSQNKSIRVASGAKQITLEARKSAYIFMKWSLSGNSGAGGGRFMPPSTVRVVS